MRQLAPYVVALAILIPLAAAQSAHAGGAVIGDAVSVERVQLTNSKAIANFWKVQYTDVWVDFHCSSSYAPGTVLLEYTDTKTNGISTARSKSCKTLAAFNFSATSQSLTRDVYTRNRETTGTVNVGLVDKYCWSMSNGFKPQRVEVLTHKLDGKLASRTYTCSSVVSPPNAIN